MENAAAALLIGHLDPLAFLAHTGTDRIVAERVLERAAQLRAQEVQAMAKAIGGECAAAVARMLR